MSLRDDSIIRDERGRIVKGSPGLHRKQAQQDTQDQSPVGDASFDDDLIAAANNYGKPRSKVGRRAWCENLRDQRPVEFAALLSKALARKGEASTNASGGGSVQVSFVTAPSGMYVNDGKLIEAADARELWARKTGMEVTDAPPTRPVLVQPRAEVNPSQPFIAKSANEITFGGDDDDEPQSA